MARKTERTNEIVMAEVMEAGVVTRPFRGKSFSISGHLSKRREDVIALIEQAGDVFDKSPSFGTTYLNFDWTASTAKPGSSKKLEAARRNGTRLLTEQQFLDLLLTGPGKDDRT